VKYESELFLPVKRLFESMDYSVNAEVKGCDVTAVNDDELIVIELKKTLSVALLAQGLSRQKTGAVVYIAVPKPKNYSPKKYRDTLYVIKKLELGLIFVNLRGDCSYAEIVQEPEPFKPVRINYKKRKQILNEIDGRSIDMNTGGVNCRKIATAYTEKCIKLACILDMYGELSPKEIKAYGGDEKCSFIMRSNVYGWFCRPRKGFYAITDKGRAGILEYPELERYYTQMLIDNKEK
jgi:hypothetical protein